LVQACGAVEVARVTLWLVVLTLAPGLELRASIPYGLLEESLPAGVTIAICILVNIALAPLVWFFMDKCVHLFLHIAWVDRLYDAVVTRTRERLHAYVERYGTVGLALFIGVPLPGSGVYSGGLGAYLLGFTFRQYMLASVLGVLIAATVVSAVVLSGASAFNFFLKA
jgi:uncharacterized membrane protein